MGSAGPGSAASACSLAGAFEERADAQPDALAVASGGRNLTYAELDSAANAVARRLRALGVGRDDVVGVVAERGWVTVVAALGVLKAGGAYAPLDPESPPGRTRAQLEDVRARAVLAPSHLFDCVDGAGCPILVVGDDGEAARLPLDVRPEDLCIVVFTSGSTGRPKAVGLEHRNLLNLIRGTDFGPRPGEGALQICAPQFDVAAFEIWATLLNGARLVCHPPGTPDPRAVCRTVVEHDVTWSEMATSTFHQLVESGPEELARMRLVLVGGEALVPRYARRFKAVCPATRLVNVYAPSETTIFAVTHEVGEVANNEPVPIGRPVAGARLSVRGDDGRPVAPGERGELYIGGPVVARGYVHRPELTAERFIAGPDGDRHYRTGDVVRERPDGALEIFGRTDDQVKIRGYRVEPGEVETHLAGCPQVAHAAVVAQEHLPGHRRLVAHVVLANGGGDEDALRRFLAERLPPYMVPAAIVVRERLPRNITGKVDRAALRAETPRPPAPQPDDDAPALARDIAAVFASVLGIPAVGPYDDFFQLGGDSLLGLQVLARMRASLGLDLPISAIFDARTPAGLAAAPATADTVPLPPLRARSHPPTSPASASQAKALLVAELAEESLPYQSQALHRIRGALDIAALERSLSAMVARHEILRTTFERVEGRWRQRVHDPDPVRLTVADLRDRPDPEAALRAHFDELARLRLDPGRLPLARWSLARVADDDHALVVVEHHVVHDGFTTALFLRELAELYTADRGRRPAALRPPGVVFRDFVAWQDELADSDHGRATLAHWRAHLADPPPAPELPFDRPRPVRQTYRGGCLRAPLPPALAEALARRAGESGSTVFMVMLAAYVALLARYGGVEELIVGTGVANRRTLASEELLGMLVNTVALRVDLAGDPSVHDLIARVRAEVLDAHEHEDVPFERVIEHLAPARSASVAPLYQTLFSFHDSAVRTLRVPGATIVPRDALANGSAKLDLSVVVVNRRGETPPEHRHLAEDGLTVVLEYNADLFDRRTAERMLGHYRQLLEGFAADGARSVAELPLAGAEERERLVAFTGRPAVYERDATIAEVFAARVAETPDAVAVSFRGESLSYARLDRWANRLAHRLRAHGVGAGSRVAVCLDRSLEMVAAYLAVAKAGGAYVPLDPLDPPARLRGHLERLGVRLVLSLGRHHQALLGQPATIVCLDDALDLEREPDSPPPSTAGALDPAYVMFTSGSTGAPKGVEVPHRAVLRLVRGADYVRLGPDETLLGLAPAAFDAATFEVWGALLNGGRLALAPPGALAPGELADLVARERVTTLWLTAGLFHRIVDDRPDTLGSLRQLLAGGDVLSPDHVRRALAALPDGATLINGYGPTEGTTFTATHAMAPGDAVEAPVPIGRPIAGTRAHILDPAGRPQPIGAVGELYIGGDGVALGYVGEPALTAERFVPDPFSADPDARLYRSGDRARWRADGTIEFLGRLDRQLKIRGFRVEPGEVEEALRSHPDVAHVHVAPYRRAAGDGGLAAHVVAVAGAEPTDAELRAHAARALPSHAVPTGWSRLARLPLGPTGKVDVAALPTPTLGSARPTGGEDLDELERRLVDIWERVLEVDGIGLDDDFFALGGHSLLAIEAFDAIERSLGQRLPLAMIFEAPTIRQLAAAVRAEGTHTSRSSLVVLTASGERPPLFFVSAGDGNSIGFGALARRLGPEQPFYALQPRGINGGALLHTSVEAMAAHYLRAIRRARPRGPYLLGGRCLGSHVAYEMATRLRARGEDVPLLVVLDSGGPTWSPRRLADGTPFDLFVNSALRHADLDLADPFSAVGSEQLVRWLLEPALHGADGTPVNRYLHEVYRMRSDIRDGFPDLVGRDARAYVDWAGTHGRALELADRFLDEAPAAVARRRSEVRGRAADAARRLAWRAVEVADLLGGERRPDAALRRRRRVLEASNIAAGAYRAGTYPGLVTLIRSEEYGTHTLVERWHGLDTAGVIERRVPGTHRSIMREPDVGALADCLRELVDDVLDREHDRSARGFPAPAAAR